MLQVGDFAAHGNAMRTLRGKPANGSIWRYQEAQESDPAEVPARLFPACQAARGLLIAAPMSAILWGLIAVSLTRFF